MIVVTYLDHPGVNPKLRRNTFNDPLIDTSTKNSWTGDVRPVRWLHEARCYGSEAKFVVTLVNADGKDEIVPTYPGDHEIRKFRNFRLTREAMETNEELERFLHEQAAAGDLCCVDIDVIDMEAYRREALEDYRVTIVVTPQGVV